MKKLILSCCALIALSFLWGCGAGDGSQAGSAGPVGEDFLDAVSRLTSPDSDTAAKRQAISDFVKVGDLRGALFLKGFREGGTIYRWKGRLVVVEKFDTDDDGNKTAKLFDHILRTSLEVDGKQAVVSKGDLEEVAAPRKLRKSAQAAADFLRLGSVDEKICEQAARKCGNSGKPEYLAPLEKLAEDPGRSEKIRRVARTGVCLIRIGGGVPDLEEKDILAAVSELGEIRSEAAVSPLEELAEQEDVSAEVKAACGSSIESIQSYQGNVRNLSHIFNGLSAGSVLILMALGLSIIFGLMGVINMAHGELMMIGAFTTYEIMRLCGHSESTPASYYFIIAIPVAFLVAGFFGILIEFFVVRHLYGRPLDTLLATYACGLIMIQGVRVIYGDNIGVQAPLQLVGSFELFQDFIVGKARVFIIGFCASVALLIYLLMARTRMGLLIRATTQNRATARSLGVNSRFVDSMTFAFGSGLAGMAGCALTLIAGVTPDMGNNYIVDSFLVVVVGGVGQLAGVISAGLGIGVLNKTCEPFFSWVFPESTASVTWGKVLILALVVAFIQWRPAGIFPPKGRLADV